MDWSNWVTHSNEVLDFFLSLVPRILDLAMSTPIIGVPIILMIIGLILGLVIRFVGALGSKNKSEG